jgi:hypothetical protein
MLAAERVDPGDRPAVGAAVPRTPQTEGSLAQPDSLVAAPASGLPLLRREVALGVSELMDGPLLGVSERHSNLLKGSWIPAGDAERNVHAIGVQLSVLSNIPRDEKSTARTPLIHRGLLRTRSRRGGGMRRREHDRRTTAKRAPCRRGQPGGRPLGAPTRFGAMVGNASVDCSLWAPPASVPLRPTRGCARPDSTTRRARSGVHAAHQSPHEAVRAQACSSSTETLPAETVMASCW